jgi:DNA-binding GntR family transcriptional regulator
MLTHRDLKTIVSCREFSVSEMSNLFRNSPLPRYAQLADLLRHRIARAIWEPGDLLPSLDNLEAEFGVARVKVRQAIERLTRQGLVLPQRGRGTLATATQRLAKTAGYRYRLVLRI